MRVFLVVLLVLALVVAGAAAWRWHEVQINRTEMTSTISKHIEAVALSSNALVALDAGDVDKARQLLRTSLDYSLQRADEIVKLGVPPYDPGRGYGDALKSARAYAQQAQLSPEIVARADRLIAALK
jgi:hypothetical protein